MELLQTGDMPVEDVDANDLECVSEDLMATAESVLLHTRIQSEIRLKSDRGSLTPSLSSISSISRNSRIHEPVP